MSVVTVNLLIAELASAAALGVSAKLALELRFEAPYVLYSVALAARLIGIGAGFAFPHSGPILKGIPSEDFGILLFYLILDGALRLSSMAYRPAIERSAKMRMRRRRLDWKSMDARGVVRAAVAPLAVVDLLHLVWGAPWQEFPGALAAKLGALATVRPGLWGAATALCLGLFCTALIASKERRG